MLYMSNVDCAACSILSAECERFQRAFAIAKERLSRGDEDTLSGDYMKLRAASDEARLDFTVARMELEYHACNRMPNLPAMSELRNRIGITRRPRRPVRMNITRTSS
jgi:hypothetical protein